MKREKVWIKKTKIFFWHLAHVFLVFGVNARGKKKKRRRTYNARIRNLELHHSMCQFFWYLAHGFLVFGVLNSKSLAFN